MNGICYIVGAGDFCGPVMHPAEGDFVIAADAGFVPLTENGIVPNALIGDFDSLPEGIKTDATVLRFPPIKDDTDMMIAIRHGLKRGYRTFRIYGGSGGKRFAHTLGNLQALAFLSKQGASAIMYEKNAEITALTDGEMQFAPRTGYLSVFAFGADAEGVTERGMKYTLTDDTLSSTLPLGVSNELLGVPATLSVRHGTLLIISPRLTEELWY